MIINEECKKCQIKRNINKYPVNATEEKITSGTFWKCDGLYRNQTALQSINA